MLRRIFALSVFGLFSLASCHHQAPATIPNFQYSFVSRTVWVTGCVPHPKRIDQVIDLHRSQFDHCARLPNATLRVLETHTVLATIPGREMTVSAKVWNTGIPAPDSERIDPEAPRETCYRQTLESLRFPEASCEQGYTITWYPEGRIR